MEQALFEQYEAAKEQGNKGLATALIAKFIGTFSTDEERKEWTRWYMVNRTFGHAVRHELFEGVMFPVLLVGHQRSDPWCIEVLERCAQNLYKADHLWSQVGYQTEMQLAERRLELIPNDPKAKTRLLEHLIAWFRYSEHEWPAGILYGADGATEAQCQEILMSIKKARTLDEGRAHLHYLNQFEAKVDQYIHRLRTSAGRPASNA
ncbi:MAG: hypothetical protein H6R15_1715 [Proteobacteria bacterium]|nr:hypothetical protein [Pseudomonadota bacterium]